METWAQPFVFEPCWTKCTRGQKVDVVIQLTCVGSDMSLGLVLPSKTPCSIVGLAPTGLTPCITLFAASVQGSTGVRMDLQLTPASVVRAHGLPSVCDVLQVVEFCAGMGASSLGLQAAGSSKLVPLSGCQPSLNSMKLSTHKYQLFLETLVTLRF